MTNMLSFGRLQAPCWAFGESGNHAMKSAFTSRKVIGLAAAAVLTAAPAVLTIAPGAAAAATMTNAQRLGMRLATPGGATKGSYGGVRVYTYAGVRCVLNGNQATAMTNAAGGWMGWTFKVSYAGRFTMKVWCAKGTLGAALSTALTVTDPAVAKTWKTDVAYEGRGRWDGPVIRLPHASHRFSYYYACDTGSVTSTGLGIAWFTGPKEFEVTIARGPEGASVYTLDGGRAFDGSGTVEVGTQDDCDWKVAFQSYR